MGSIHSSIISITFPKSKKDHVEKFQWRSPRCRGAPLWTSHLGIRMRSLQPSCHARHPCGLALGGQDTSRSNRRDLEIWFSGTGIPETFGRAAETRVPPPS
ncbi:hypothetical protein CCM_08312 [Cordyceps militaris CM01]|uniref:Uncharacterized protein n=1 Tax=Cordyceps militaris (strain CM01) TaxID=983644 RepID=G3JTC2_CORMM|nr:uncharacterized protein CCM_08312 [Cordyceps militaris CM01]EGX88269.1 hypothetical protein CCM_08312 [Cordyceps militaris CM01]